ncbi:ABC transporter permease [Dermacoccaceae bacterium W4C1]
MTAVDLHAVPPLSLERVPPRMGGWNTTLVRIELRRYLRNRRTMIFALVMPVAFYFLFGTSDSYAGERAGAGNVAAYIMTSMALYGAMIATAAGGSSVAIERAQGWSRQLRLTPLSSSAYIVTKLIVALLIAAVPVVAVFICGMVGKADLSMPRAVACALLVWIGSAVFAAFGLFVGYLFPGENAMQVMGPLMALLAFGGGLFIPLPDHGFMHVFSRLTPMWGVAQLVHAPQTGWGGFLGWLANIVVWLAIFISGAAWAFRRDTRRG